MAADEISEAFLRVVFRYVVYFFVEILWELICYYIGFSVVRLVTLGKYPQDQPTMAQEIIASTVGFLLLLFGMMWLIGFLALRNA